MDPFPPFFLFFCNIIFLKKSSQQRRDRARFSLFFVDFCSFLYDKMNNQKRYKKYALRFTCINLKKKHYFLINFCDKLLIVKSKQTYKKSTKKQTF